MDPPLGSAKPGDDGLIDIFDEDVPLASVPKTGDAMGLWMMLSGSSLGGLVALKKKKRKK